MNKLQTFQISTELYDLKLCLNGEQLTIKLKTKRKIYQTRLTFYIFSTELKTYFGTVSIIFEWLKTSKNYEIDVNEGIITLKMDNQIGNKKYMKKIPITLEEVSYKSEKQKMFEPEKKIKLEKNNSPTSEIDELKLKVFQLTSLIQKQNLKISELQETVQFLKKSETQRLKHHKKPENRMVKEEDEDYEKKEEEEYFECLKNKSDSENESLKSLNMENKDQNNSEKAKRPRPQDFLNQDRQNLKIIQKKDDKKKGGNIEKVQRVQTKSNRGKSRKKAKQFCDQQSYEKELNSKTKEIQKCEKSSNRSRSKSVNKNKKKNEENNEVYTYMNGDEYKGKLYKGVPHGFGKLKCKNGDSYEGTFRNGIMHGRGKYFYQSKDRYEGELRNDLAEGEGIYYHYNNDKFVGQYKKDKRQGHGRYYFANGNIFDGYFENDKEDGVAYMNYTDGSVFEEIWKKGTKMSQKKLK